MPFNKEDVDQISDVVRKGVTEATAKVGADFDGLKKQFEEMAGTIKSIEEKQVVMAKSSKVVSLPGCDEGKEKFSFARMLKGIGTNDWKGCGFEKEVLDQSMQKALDAGTGANGGFVVPTQYVPELIEMLDANLVLSKLGITRINPASAPVDIPRQLTGATAYWVGENAAITASQGSFDQVVMNPKSVAALVKASRRLVQLADPSIEQIIRRDIAMSLASAIDIKALLGDGTGNTPVGVINQAGISTLSVGANGDDFDYAFALELIGKLEDNNALMGSLGFVSNPAVFRKLKRQAVAQFSGDTKGAPLFAPILSDENLAKNLGYNVQTSTAVPKAGTKGTGTALSKVIFGNWQDLILAQWGSLMIESSTVAGDGTGGAFTSHQMWFKAVMEMDVAVRHPKSFAVATDVLTA